MHAFKATKSKNKMICAKFEICRKSLEKNFELLPVNTSFHMRVEHPFINAVNWLSQNLALTAEFRRNKKRMETWVGGNEKKEVAIVGKGKPMKICTRIPASDSSFVRETSFTFCSSYFLKH